MLLSLLESFILILGPLEATTAGSKKPTLAEGNYRVLKVRRGTVWFRAEAESDMAACAGKDIEPPKVLPPTLSAPAAQFFTADGIPRFGDDIQEDADGCSHPEPLRNCY